jgi:hypothetical protein
MLPVTLQMDYENTYEWYRNEPRGVYEQRPVRPYGAPISLWQASPSQYSLMCAFFCCTSCAWQYPCFWEVNLRDNKKHSYSCTSTCRNGSHWGATDVLLQPESVDSFMEHIHASMDAGDNQNEEDSSMLTGSTSHENE